MESTELISFDDLAPQLKGTIFTDSAYLYHFPCIASTNSAAMEAAAEGAPEGTVFLADEQTAGRGRGDHTWHSEPRAGIYLSVILRPQLESCDAPLLSLAAGLAVYDAVRQVTGLSPDLKWPNDVLLTEPGQPAPRKFCGILAEMASDKAWVRYVVVGLGMNVNHASFPPELAGRATSLRRASGRIWPRAVLVTALLQSLDAAYYSLRQNTPQSRLELMRRFEAHASMVHGRHVRVSSGATGSAETTPLTGITAGLDDHGFLLLRTDAGVQPVLAGSIEFLEA